MRYGRTIVILIIVAGVAYGACSTGWQPLVKGIFHGMTEKERVDYVNDPMATYPLLPEWKAKLRPH